MVTYTHPFTGMRFKWYGNDYRNRPPTPNSTKLTHPFQEDFHGLWITPNELQKPDIVLYYCHGTPLPHDMPRTSSHHLLMGIGGGFSMGSGYFYLEFLLAWARLLKDAGYRNPAIFALEYTLVPDAVYPTQLEETISGYNYVLSITGNSSRICVGGDSAGATLILSLLLRIAESPNGDKRRPGYATLISPWVTMVTPNNRNTASDYLNADSLHLYGRQYAASESNLQNPLVSPGICKDVDWWARASPSSGFCILFGSEEVFGPEIRNLAGILRKSGCAVRIKEEPGSIHAWPVVTLFLANTQEERQKGLRDLVKMIKQNI